MILYRNYLSICLLISSVQLVVFKMISTYYYADIMRFSIYITIHIIGLILLEIVFKNKHKLKYIAKIPLVYSIFFLLSLSLFIIEIPKYTYNEAKYILLNELDPSVEIKDNGPKREKVEKNHIFIDSVYSFYTNNAMYLINPNNGEIIKK